MITEDFVSFEIAKLLKEKGFNSISFHCYEEKETNGILFVILSAPLSNSDLDNTIEPHKCYSAPTLQMAMKWLREKHILIVHDYMDGSAAPWVYHIWCTDNPEESHSAHFKTYEEACEAAIKYCLKNLI